MVSQRQPYHAHVDTKHTKQPNQKCFCHQVNILMTELQTFEKKIIFVLAVSYNMPTRNS